MDVPSPYQLFELCVYRALPPFALLRTRGLLNVRRLPREVQPLPRSAQMRLHLAVRGEDALQKEAPIVLLVIFCCCCC
jgi:hypothetical protein